MNLEKSLEGWGRNLVLSPPVGVSPTRGIVTALSLRPPPPVTASSAVGSFVMFTMISATSAWATSTYPGSASLATPKLVLPLRCGEAAPVICGGEILREFDHFSQLAVIPSKHVLSRGRDPRNHRSRLGVGLLYLRCCKKNCLKGGVPFRKDISGDVLLATSTAWGSMVLVSYDANVKTLGHLI